MQLVAHHLQVEAIRIAPAAEADAFARSAFNRYYYATFLCVRDALVEIDAKYEDSLKHKEIPGMLRGSIHKRIGKIMKKASKLDDTRLVAECRQASSQNLSFAEVLSKAYAIRVVADYNPHTQVKFNPPRFELSGVSVNEAHSWAQLASVWSAAVLRVIRQENA